jgi:hypothetical protein
MALSAQTNVKTVERSTVRLPLVAPKAQLCSPADSARPAVVLHVLVTPAGVWR